MADSGEAITTYDAGTMAIIVGATVPLADTHGMEINQRA